MAKKPYTVKEPLRHDGKDYAIDDSIDLDIGEDHLLLQGGIVVPSMKKPSKAEAEAKAKAEAEANAKADVAGAEAAAAVVENTTGQGE